MTDAMPPGAATGGEPILSARNLVKHFPVRTKGLFKRTVGHVHAVDDVSFELAETETLGLVGESGCGKSTTARLLLNLIPATSGEVYYRGYELQSMSRRRLRPLRKELQIVFQDPFASLDPRMTVANLIGEPLQIQGTWDKGGRKRVQDLLEMVGLNPEHSNRYPHEFSGGQRQRIGVARALATQPKVMILDEPVSALDVSIQAGVINLLEDLQNEFDLSYVFVAHDLSVVRHIADRVAVMYLGQIIETGATEQLFQSATHPYTQALISSIPLPDPRKERSRERIVVTGDVPSPIDPPGGCRFRTRCPKFANHLSESERQRCIEEDPTRPATTPKRCSCSDGCPDVASRRRGRPGTVVVGAGWRGIRGTEDETVTRRNEPLETLLGPLEQEVMEVMWRLGDATVRDVHGELATARSIAYTTVMTTMTRLAAKGLLQRDTAGLAHRYRPAVSRERYAQSAVGDVLTWLLDRYPEPAAAYLAEAVDDIDGVSLDALREAVERRRQQER